jgi:hypothetical protein
MCWVDSSRSKPRFSGRCSQRLEETGSRFGVEVEGGDGVVCGVEGVRKMG